MDLTITIASVIISRILRLDSYDIQCFGMICGGHSTAELPKSLREINADFQSEKTRNSRIPEHPPKCEGALSCCLRTKIVSDITARVSYDTVQYSTYEYCTFSGRGHGENGREQEKQAKANNENININNIQQ